MTDEPASATAEPGSSDRPLDPAKLLRLANLVREVLHEARSREPGETTSAELAGLYGRVEKQLHEALPAELSRELEEIDLDLSFDQGATGEEVRVVYAGLLGWLGGLFQGLQASAQAQAVHLLERAKDGDMPKADEQSPEKEGYL